MILKQKYEQGGAEASVTVCKTAGRSADDDGRWAVQITVSGVAATPDKAAAEALKLMRVMGTENPVGHLRRCECELCKLWKIEDAKNRLSEDSD